MSQAWPVSTATITNFPGGTADVADGSFPTDLTGPTCHLMYASPRKRPKRYLVAK